MIRLSECPNAQVRLWILCLCPAAKPSINGSLQWSTRSAMQKSAVLDLEPGPNAVLDVAYLDPGRVALGPRHGRLAVPNGLRWW